MTETPLELAQRLRAAVKAGAPGSKNVDRLAQALIDSEARVVELTDEIERMEDECTTHKANADDAVEQAEAREQRLREALTMAQTLLAACGLSNVIIDATLLAGRTESSCKCECHTRDAEWCDACIGPSSDRERRE